MKSCKKNGFTLAEIMIALGVFVIGATGIIALLGKSMNMYIEAGDLKKASLMSYSILGKCEAIVDQDYLPVNVVDGTMEAFPGYYYDVLWDELEPNTDQEGDDQEEEEDLELKLDEEISREDSLMRAGVFLVTVIIKWENTGEGRQKVFQGVVHRKWRDKKNVNLPKN